MEEEERTIRAMTFVTTLSFVRAVKDKAEGWRVTLTCFDCREYNSNGKNQEESVHISGERPTLLACFQELRKRLEEHHCWSAEASASGRSKCKWQEYKDTRYSHGDSTLVVELWLHRVPDDTSGLTFQEWDP
jgi:hypothetical protein